MGTIKTAHYESQTNGTVPTAANSTAGGDSAMSTPVISGAAMVYSSDASKMAHGSMSVKMSGLGTTNYAQLIYNGYSATTFRTRHYLIFDSLPTSACNFWQTRSASTALGGMQITTAAKITVSNPSGGTVLNTSTGTISANTLYRLETITVIDASVGRVAYALYAGDSTTALTGLSYDSGNVLNTGVTTITECRVGKITTTATGLTNIYVDDPYFEDGVASFIGPYNPAANVPPTSNAGGDQQVALGSAITLAGSGSDSDGSVASYAWTLVSTPAGAATPTINSPTSATTTTNALNTAGTYVFRLTVTDNLGATTPDDVNIVVMPAVPSVSGTITTNEAVVDATATSGGTTLSYSISPSSGTSQPSNGVFIVPPGATYVVTATDAYGQSGTHSFVVPAGSSGITARTLLRIGGTWTTA